MGRRFALDLIKKPRGWGDEPTLIGARSPIHAGKVGCRCSRELFIYLHSARQITSELIDRLFMDISLVSVSWIGLVIVAKQTQVIRPAHRKIPSRVANLPSGASEVHSDLNIV
jgi:hypothetical protein